MDMQNVYQNITKGSRDRTNFTFFRIWTYEKPRPILNVIWQSHWLHLVNQFHHNILHSSRDRVIFTFSEFGARQNILLQFVGLDHSNIKLSAKFYQNIPNGLSAKFQFFRPNLDQSQMSFDNLMSYILSIPMCMQNFITIFHSVQAIGPFSLFQNLELGKTSTDEKWHFTISWATSCQYQCLHRSLSKYST